jgi:hypothetical protein
MTLKTIRYISASDSSPYGGILSYLRVYKPHLDFEVKNLEIITRI